jgi:hypothetical protein
MKANQLLFVSIAAVAGCGHVNLPDHAAGDAAMGSGSDFGSSSGSDVNPDPPGSHPPGTIYGHIKDERGDTIDFSTNEPVHTHAGASIDVSTDCPDVYKYAYLASNVKPAYGREVTPNPIAFHIQAPDSTDAAYRVRTDDGRTLLDWTPMSPDGDGVYTMELHRDDATQMAALGTDVRQMYIDARLTTDGNQTIATRCWANHPLAAPLQVLPLADSTLFGMSLPANSPISVMLNSGAGIDVFSLPLVLMTNEPTVITISGAPPSGQGTQTGADTYIVASSTAVNLSCGPDVYDAGCNDAPNGHTVTTPASGPLAGSWSLRVVDDTSNQVVCTFPAGGCALPGRGGTPRAFHAVWSLASASIAPYGTATYGEFTVGTRQYTGTAPSIGTGCSQFRTHVNTITGVTYTFCFTTSTIGHARLLDQARIDFDALTMTINSQIGEPMMPAISPIVLAAHTWDAGSAGF